MARLSDISAEIKAEARGALLGKLGISVGANLLTMLIALVLTEISLSVFSGSSAVDLIGSEAVSFLIALFVGILLYGLFYIYMSLLYGQPVVFSDLFRGFRRESSDRIIRVQAVLSAINILSMLPAMILIQITPQGQLHTRALLLAVFCIIGFGVEIYFELTFSMSYFILIDFPEMSAADVLRTGRNMMAGRKGRLLYISLSFLPLYLLGLLSFGIANLWVSAYHAAALAAFYRREAAQPSSAAR